MNARTKIEDPRAAAGARVVTGELFRVRRGRGKGFAAEAPPAPPAPAPVDETPRPARVAITLALAHKIQQAIDGGAVRDRAEVARRLGLTRARVTQILDLTLLAPEIQERLLDREAADGEVPERALRAIVRRVAWAEQTAAWSELSLGSGAE